MDKIEAVIDEALQKGRELERERCAALARLMAEKMLHLDDAVAASVCRELEQRIMSPKA